MAVRQAVEAFKRLPSQLGVIRPANTVAALGECQTCGARGIQSQEASISGGIGSPTQDAAGMRPAQHQQLRGGASAAAAAPRQQASASLITAQRGAAAAGVNGWHAGGIAMGGVIVFGLGWSMSSASASAIQGFSIQDPLPGILGSTSPAASVLSPYFIADAAAKAAPAVVNISVQDPRRPADDAANGSGFIISSDGIVVTNTHIVADAIPAQAGPERRILCTLQDGRSFAAELINFDWPSDLAVLRVRAAAELPVAKLGRSAALRVGEWVLALGSPLHLSNSVSAGIVSAVARKGAELGLDTTSVDYIQTDAATSSGSSGGPLVNVQGEVIGISNLKALAADSVSFAIPIDTAKEVLDQLLSPAGRVVRPYIGCKTLQLNSSLAAELKANASSFPDLAEGILVSYVHPSSPADRAGLISGDVITCFSSSSGLTRALTRSVGKPLPLKVVRSDGSRVTLSVVPRDAMQAQA